MANHPTMYYPRQGHCTPSEALTFYIFAKPPNAESTVPIGALYCGDDVEVPSRRRRPETVRWELLLAARVC